MNKYVFHFVLIIGAIIIALTFMANIHSIFSLFRSKLWTTLSMLAVIFVILLYYFVKPERGSERVLELTRQIDEFVELFYGDDFTSISNRSDIVENEIKKELDKPFDYCGKLADTNTNRFQISKFENGDLFIALKKNRDQGVTFFCLNNIAFFGTHSLDVPYGWGVYAPIAPSSVRSPFCGFADGGIIKYAHFDIDSNPSCSSAVARAEEFIAESLQ